MKSLISVLLGALFLAGCGSSLKVERGGENLPEKLESTRFFLSVDDGSGGNPDNIDGFVNLAWTDDKDRSTVVRAQIGGLLALLEDEGFEFVEQGESSTVTAKLLLKSVRYDPVGGWVTDDASLTYIRRADDEFLGKVIAGERFITPSVEEVFKRLYEGSVALWLN